MPERLVYDLDPATGALPPGWTLTRASDAWRRVAPGQWDRVEAGRPVTEDLQVAAGASQPRQALRLEPRVTNLVPASIMGTGLWSGEAAMRHRTRMRPAVATAKAVLTEGLGAEDDPVLRASDPGTDAQVVTLWALLEAVDAERLAAGTYDDVSGWHELLHVRAEDGSVVATAGSSHWRRVVDLAGTGPNGGRLYRLVFTGPRFGDDAALAPLGLYANHLRAVVHHAQLEETPGPTSPVPGGATREEDRLTATPESMPLPWTLSLEAVTAPWSGREQVLWQADRDSDDDCLRIVRREEGALHLEQWVGGSLAVDVELVATLDDAASLGLAVCIQADLTVRWSLAGGAEQTATLPSWPGYVRERLGCAAMVGPSWGGWLARARRWHDAAADLTGLSTDTIGLAGTAPVPVPAAVIPETTA